MRYSVWMDMLLPGHESPTVGFLQREDGDGDWVFTENLGEAHRFKSMAECIESVTAWSNALYVCLPITTGETVVHAGECFEVIIRKVG